MDSARPPPFHVAAGVSAAAPLHPQLIGVVLPELHATQQLLQHRDSHLKSGVPDCPPGGPQSPPWGASTCLRAPPPTPCVANRRHPCGGEVKHAAVHFSEDVLCEEPCAELRSAVSQAQARIRAARVELLAALRSHGEGGESCEDAATAAAVDALCSAVASHAHAAVEERAAEERVTAMLEEYQARTGDHSPPEGITPPPQPHPPPERRENPAELAVKLAALRKRSHALHCLWGMQLSMIQPP
eukprot:Hpha_TRINITY_DN20918_c0_g1::TRINITY_DN20918_c0_g1_i1::g.139651::m.139651